MDEALSRSDRLSIQRTALALDRTLMAWIRTSVSTISFGFTLYKFLQYLQEQGVSRPINPNGPRNLGLFLIVMGTVPLIMALVQFWNQSRILGRSPRALLVNPGLLAAFFMMILGLALLVSIAIRRDLF